VHIYATGSIEKTSELINHISAVVPGEGERSRCFCEIKSTEKSVVKFDFGIFFRETTRANKIERTPQLSPCQTQKHTTVRNN